MLVLGIVGVAGHSSSESVGVAITGTDGDISLMGGSSTTGGDHTPLSQVGMALELRTFFVCFLERGLFFELKSFDIVMSGRGFCRGVATMVTSLSRGNDNSSNCPLLLISFKGSVICNNGGHFPSSPLCLCNSLGSIN